VLVRGGGQNSFIKAIKGKNRYIMCGICGICRSADAREDVKLMMETLRHRGPDASGEFIDMAHQVAFGHRRLSILDLSESGKQPMVSLDNKKVICLNGEIYNFKEIKKDLPNDIINSLKSNGDTAVLLESIAYFGYEKTLEKIRGMFSIALLDLGDGTIYLARDRAGEKPLYYGFIEDKFIFASELKAIQKLAKKYRYTFSLDYDAVYEYLQYSYIPAPNTIYCEIKKLEPGEMAIIRMPYNEINQIKRYWKLNAGISKTQIGFQEGKRELKKLLEQAITEQMVADVPYGAFLSGGIDSSLITAYMQKILGKPVKTFSIGFENKIYNEANFAKEVADYIGSDHREMYITEREALDLIPELGKIYDEPYADSSQIPTFFLSEFAKTEVTIALTGDAGDELFCGYEHYIKFNNIYGKLNRIPNGLRHIAGWSLSGRWISPINFFTNNNRVYKLSRLLKSDSEAEFFYQMRRADTSKNGILHSRNEREFPYATEEEKYGDFISNMQYIDFMTYLPNDILVKVDRAAMKNSLETRIPFLDRRIIEFAYSLPLKLKFDGINSKKILRDLLYEEIPRELLERPKRGFGIPLDDWLRGDLKDWAESLIFSDELQCFPGIDYKAITRLWSKEVQGKYHYKTIIWNILMLAQWLKENKENYRYI